MTHPHIDDSRIAETAYLLWLDEGRPQGRDREHWLRAIDALTPATPKAEAVKAPAKPRAVKPKAADTAETAPKPAKAKSSAKTASAPKTAKAKPAAKKPRAAKTAKAPTA